MSFQVTCTFEKALPIASGTSNAGKEWKNREFVCSYKDGQYDKKISFKVFNDQLIDYVGKITQGSELEVSFSVESREYKGRWYPDVTAFKVMNHSQDLNHDNNAVNAPAYNANDVPPEDDVNDLPF